MHTNFSIICLKRKHKLSIVTVVSRKRLLSSRDKWWLLSVQKWWLLSLQNDNIFSWKRWPFSLDNRPRNVIISFTLFMKAMFCLGRERKSRIMIPDLPHDSIRAIWLAELRNTNNNMMCSSQPRQAYFPKCPSVLLIEAEIKRPPFSRRDFQMHFLERQAIIWTNGG